MGSKKRKAPDSRRGRPQHGSMQPGRSRTAPQGVPGKGAPARSSRPQSRPPQSRPPQNRPTQSRPLSAQQRRMTDRAYSQAVRHRRVKGRRRGSRGGNYIMYYILAAIVIITVLIILSNTVLFNCSGITVEGNSRYTVEQITGQSGINVGDNLLHIDEKAAESRIYTAFPFIDEVDVQRSFPTKVKIVVREAEKWFLVSGNGVTAAVSRMGRIVELGSSEGLPVIVGYQPAELAPGKALVSEESGKNQLPEEILEKIEEHDIPDVTTIDITDRFDISIECGDDVTIRIGGVADLDSKLAAASQAMKNEHGSVVIDVQTLEKVFARDKVKDQQQLPDLNASAETTSEASTGEAAGGVSQAE